MSVSFVLSAWKDLATNSVKLDNLRDRISSLENVVAAARHEFESNLDELDEADREAISSIVGVYESPNPDSHDANWVLGKVGNEGIDGIRFETLAKAWKGLFPDRPVSALTIVLAKHSTWFTRVGNGKESMLRLSKDGQQRFHGASQA